MRLVGLILVAAFLSFFAVPQAALAWDGYVVRVEDSNCVAVGDEPNSTEVRARLFFYGIQAPTGKQPMAAQTMAFLQQILPPGTPVTVDEAGEDENGLTRALIRSGGTSINYLLLQRGLAWVDRRRCRALYCRRWMIQEHYAVTDRAGIWGLDLGTPPWQWQR